LADEAGILVFIAHVADFCSRCGGTLALYTRNNVKVHVVCLTFGERGESGDYWRQLGDTSVSDAKKTRRVEAEAAATVLGTTIQFLDFNDYPLEINRERIECLARIIRDNRPNIILTHWKEDPYNVDHAVTTTSVIRAADIAAVPGFDPSISDVLPVPHMFGFEPTVPRDDDAGFVPDTYVDISTIFETKIKALGKIKSQSELPERYTMWSKYRGAQATQWSGRKIVYAEAFRRFTAVVGTRLPVMDAG
jgi:4-oxalomesaconate hydratase